MRCCKDVFHSRAYTTSHYHTLWQMPPKCEKTRYCRYECGFKTESANSRRVHQSSQCKKNPNAAAARQRKMDQQRDARRRRSEMKTAAIDQLQNATSETISPLAPALAS